MQVLKFGGTSIGSADAIKSTVEIILATEHQSIIVFSAFSGVTNLLSEITSLLILGQVKKARIAVEDIHTRHLNIIFDLFDDVRYRSQAVKVLNRHLSIIRAQITESPFDYNPWEILAQGELISSQIILIYFTELNLSVSLINALDYMKLNENEEPDLQRIKSLLSGLINKCPHRYILTQGYICKNTKGETENLKRGGSDYSAAIIGVAVNAPIIQIWTDIDGLHNNDPRFVNDTESISSLSFEEAAELAYYGAKVLHPQSILPAKEANIPVLLKNTFEPSKAGTLIQKQQFKNGVRAIAAKDGITSIKLKSYRTLMFYDFLKNVFEVFEHHKTSIDVMTTSQGAVSLTIDSTQNLQKIADQLSTYGEVIVEDGLSVICVVGYFPCHQVGWGVQILTALKNIPILMISFGGSEHNISLIVKSEDKVTALNNLHRHIFQKEGNLVFT